MRRRDLEDRRVLDRRHPVHRAGDVVEGGAGARSPPASRMPSPPAPSSSFARPDWTSHDSSFSRWNCSDSDCPALHEQHLAAVGPGERPDQLVAPRLLDPPHVDAHRSSESRFGESTTSAPILSLPGAPSGHASHSGWAATCSRRGGAPSACSPSARGRRGGTRAAGPRPRAPGTSSTRGRRAPGTARSPHRVSTYWPQLTQYGTRPASSKPADDVLVVDVDDTELRLRLRHGDRRERAAVSVPREQRCEVDVEQLVAVQREHVAARLAQRRAANLIPPPRPSRSGSSAATISAPSPASSLDEQIALPEAHAKITRVDPRRARAGRPGTRRAACPPTSTSAFGRPPRSVAQPLGLAPRRG